MRILTSLSNGSPASVVVRADTEARLRGTCFRGAQKRVAGNFSLWGNAYDLITDGHVHEQLLDDVLETAEEGSVKRIVRRSVTIFHTEYVGWESTDDMGNYPEDVVEQYYHNPKCSWLRIIPGRRDICAPRTNALTIVYELRFEKDGWVVIVWSIYPGVDVGKLKGNVTEREGRVFFDWNHPGA